MSIRDFFDKVPPEDRPEIGEAETSANFDVEEVETVLESLSRLPGLTIPVGRLVFIAGMIDGLQVGETRAYEVVGEQGGEMCLLTIEAFRNDIGDVDLRFVGTDAVVAIIDAMLDSEDGA